MNTNKLSAAALVLASLATGAFAQNAAAQNVEKCYGVALAGWSSNNKYSRLGGLRASAQMVSYEISLGLSLVGVLIMSVRAMPLKRPPEPAGQ